MEIEIKKIKIVITFLSFFLFISFGYYVFASVNEIVSTTDSMNSSEAFDINSSDNLTAKLAQGLKPLLTPNDDGSSKSVNLADLDGALQSSLGDSLSDDTLTLDSLPEFIVPENKVTKQAYANLSESDRKEKIKQDTLNYLVNISYLLINNAPPEILQQKTIKPFVENLLTHINDLSQTPPNYSYYTPLKNRLQVFIDEANLIPVPENMLYIHKNGMRILKAYLALGDSAPTGGNDPVAQSMFIKKIQALITISRDYLTQSYYEISNYINGTPIPTQNQ